MNPSMDIILEPIEVIVERVFFSGGQKYVSFDTQKYGIKEKPIKDLDFFEITKGVKLMAMIGMSGIPDFIGDKPIIKNVCTSSLTVYSLYCMDGRVLFQDEDRIYS